MFRIPMKRAKLFYPISAATAAAVTADSDGYCKKRNNRFPERVITFRGGSLSIAL